jgi:hypothetical protein
MAGLYAQSSFSYMLQGNRPGFGESVQLFIPIKDLQHALLFYNS